MDGSGPSRMNQITPQQLTTPLAARKQPWFCRVATPCPSRTAGAAGGRHAGAAWVKARLPAAPTPRGFHDRGYRRSAGMSTRRPGVAGVRHHQQQLPGARRRGESAGGSPGRDAGGL
ncbi:hypothetical protein M8494_20160 [Serratia ureilytica]